MFSRRMLMGGAAATLWLPFLPSALPRAAWGAAPPADPRRLLYWFVPNGMLANSFTPATLGPNYDLPFAIEPILPIQSRVTVVSDMANLAAPMVSGGHNSCMVAMLADHTLDHASVVLDGGATVDQCAVKNMDSVTPFASMQLGMDEPYAEAPNLDNAYMTTLSWANGQTPLAQLTDPKTVFDRMFAGSDPEVTAEEIARRTELRKSLLDGLVDRTAALHSHISAVDKVKLDQFTTSVRELETRIDALAQVECPAPDEPASNLGFAEGVSVMSDLIAVAFQCDYTRVITFATGASVSLTTYDFLGIPNDHHTLSHAQIDDEDAKTKLLTIMNWQSSMWTALCERLAAVPEGSGDMLSNTLVNMVSEMGQSAQHTATPMVVLVAGGEAGGILQGHHRSVGLAPHSNLWRTELEFMGVDSSGFGENATGAFDLSIA